MSVGSVARSSATLQKLLQRDQTALSRDRSGNAGQPVIQGDQARIALDQANLAAAIAQQAKAAPAPATSAPEVPAPDAPGPGHVAGKAVDLYL